VVEARELHERALRIMEREFGPDHLEVARILSNLGWRGATWGSRPRPASTVSYILTP
jgi:hypothetical protein